MENFGNVEVIDVITGTVKYFKGTIGFITPDDTRMDDIFIHYSNIEPWRKGFKELKKGDKVRFGYRERGMREVDGQRKMGYEAVNLEVLREKVDTSRFQMNNSHGIKRD